MTRMFEQYEDAERLNKADIGPFLSPYQDYRHYYSSVTPGIRLGLNVIKPEVPGSILVQLHGWHMSMPKPMRRELPGELPYLVVQVDMRGRAFSEGRADCNGFELIDIYDAVQFVREEYAEHIDRPELVYVEGGSGGGGNTLAAVAKFPDLFAAATALYGVADYARWYREDRTGEFRDEMDVWIGCDPQKDPARYAARSGLALAANLHTPLYMAHGSGDLRIPVSHSRLYAGELARLGKTDLIRYDELQGVGAEGHTASATADQLKGIQDQSELNRRQHRMPIELAPKGSLHVGGYLYTRYFRIHLDSADRLAVVHYDLADDTIRITADRRCSYRLRRADGRMEEGICEPE